MSDRSSTDDIGEHVRTELVGFVRALRRDGAAVPTNAAPTAARALAEVGLENRRRVRTALRATLLTDSTDFETFDRLFETFWRRLTAGLEDEHSLSSLAAESDDGLALFGEPTVDEHATEVSTDSEDTDRVTGRSLAESFATAVSGDTNTDDTEATAALYSPSGVASTVDGHSLTAVGDLSRAFRELTRALAGLQGRRFEPGSDRADIRRTLRTSLSTGGTVLSLPKRDRQRTAIRALLAVDVSQSVLDAVDRGFLIDVLRQACHNWRDTRVFFFDEELREVTESVDAPSSQAAIAALEAAETAWGGGTQIGGSLERLRERAPDAVDRHTVVFIISDGLDRGDVDSLERELSWIARRAMRVLWLNPLAATDSYEPAARGMAAALPYIDGLFAFADPSDISELARQLRQQGAGGRIGYEFDTRANRQMTTQTVTKL